MYSNCKDERIDHGEFINSDFDDVRQPELADKAGNSYVTETVTDTVEILTVNLEFDTYHPTQVNTPRPSPSQTASTRFTYR